MSQITAAPRITTARAQELIARAELTGMLKALKIKDFMYDDVDGYTTTASVVFCEDLDPDDYLCRDVFSAEASDETAMARAELLAAAPDLAADLLDARAECERWRAEYEALTQQVAARVDATEHARAVQEAWEDGASTQHAREQYCGKGRADTDFEWPASDSKRDLLATLARCVGAERAAALLDGGA